jgi:hypothetical protein
MRNDWYDLFSRGARDWLRHNDKVREAVLQHLPEALCAPDLMTGAGQRGIRVPLSCWNTRASACLATTAVSAQDREPAEPGDLLRSPVR